VRPLSTGPLSWFSLAVAVGLLTATSCAPRPAITPKRGCCGSAGASCRRLPDLPLHRPDPALLRPGLYSITLSATRGSQAGKTARGRLLLRRASSKDRSPRTSDRVGDESHRTVRLVGAIDIDHRKVGASICPPYGQQAGEEPVVKDVGHGSESDEKSCSEPHPASCDPVYPGVLVSHAPRRVVFQSGRYGKTNPWLHLEVGMDSNYRGNKARIQRWGYKLVVTELGASCILGRWYQEGQLLGHFHARRTSGKAGQAICQRADEASSRPLCACRGALMRRAVSRMPAEARAYFVSRPPPHTRWERDSTMRGLISALYDEGAEIGRTYSRCSSDLFGCFEEEARTRADQKLLARLDCQRRLMETIKIRTMGLRNQPFLSVVTALQQTIDQHMAKRRSVPKTCGGKLTIKLTGDGAACCRGKDCFGGLPPAISLNLALRILSRNATFTTILAPGQLQLELHGCCPGGRPDQEQSPTFTSPSRPAARIALALLVDGDLKGRASIRRALRIWLPGYLRAHRGKAIFVDEAHVGDHGRKRPACTSPASCFEAATHVCSDYIVIITVRVHAASADVRVLHADPGDLISPYVFTLKALPARGSVIDGLRDHLPRTVLCRPDRFNGFISAVRSTYRWRARLQQTFMARFRLCESFETVRPPARTSSCRLDSDCHGRLVCIGGRCVEVAPIRR
jgi:hypothetical protein